MPHGMISESAAERENWDLAPSPSNPPSSQPIMVQDHEGRTVAADLPEAGWSDTLTGPQIRNSTSSNQFKSGIRSRRRSLDNYVGFHQTKRLAATSVSPSKWSWVRGGGLLAAGSLITAATALALSTGSFSNGRIPGVSEWLSGSKYHNLADSSMASTAPIAAPGFQSGNSVEGVPVVYHLAEPSTDSVVPLSLATNVPASASTDETVKASDIPTAINKESDQGTEEAEAD